MQLQKWCKMLNTVKTFDTSNIFSQFVAELIITSHCKLKASLEVFPIVLKVVADAVLR